jgi:hypothetical protein
MTPIGAGWLKWYDGTIPAWTGGMPTNAIVVDLCWLPGGWNYERATVVLITAQNVDPGTRTS